MKSYFVTGTDTDVGKTYVTAALASAIHKKGIDVGIMKPFAAGTAQQTGFKSSDAEILANACNVNDSESLVNPQFFTIPASPFTAHNTLGEKIDLPLVLDSYEKLSKLHDVMIVEGMGGIMTPITNDYFISDLIKEMNLDTIIITRSKVGAVNHTLMTYAECKQKKIPVHGIIINQMERDGYPINDLKRDLESLTGVPVLGVIPYVDSFDVEFLSSVVEKEILGNIT